MPAHMLSYQWDGQALVEKQYNRLQEDGLPVWMDIEGGVSGNINDAMAAGVEESVVICPFMTPAYEASRSCKKELNYADTREVIIVPVMLANNWEGREWLGLITAGLLWVDLRYYRNVVTNRYLGFDPSRNQVYSEASPSMSEEWLMLVDQTDHSHHHQEQTLREVSWQSKMATLLD